MSLWNNIKGWFDKEESPQKVEQPAGKSVQIVETSGDITAKQLFEKMCIDSGISVENLRKTRAIELFSDWYVGPADRKQVALCYEQFKNAHPIIQKKFGDTVIK
tara:strand:+ start:467 stop:778 length:312 start_codon:yes stop_codon:yes gene_type:complete